LTALTKIQFAIAPLGTQLLFERVVLPAQVQLAAALATRQLQVFFAVLREKLFMHAEQTSSVKQLWQLVMLQEMHLLEDESR
jgi:hypothetical protein